MVFTQVADAIIGFLTHPWFLLSLAFWIGVLVLIFLLRKKKHAYSIFFPLLALFKTRKLNRFIRKLSSKRPKTWRVFWNIGIFVSFGFMIYAFYFFFTNLIGMFIAPNEGQQLVPLIPGLTIDIGVFMYLILPLLFVITTHEFAHGISSTIDGVEIKSTGVLGVGLFFLLGFGAFVEVDEREVRSKKYHRNTRFRIATSGTFVNGITAGVTVILLLLFPLMTSPWFIQVSQVVVVFPSEQGGFNYDTLEPMDAINAIKNAGAPDQDYVYLDTSKQITLGTILENQTSVEATIGSNLTFKVYNSVSDTHSEKEVIVGPRYDLGISWEYPDEANNELKITYNYTSDQPVDITINTINGTAINIQAGITLELFLTDFNLHALNLTSDTGTNYLVDAQVVGAVIGVYSTYYWMFQNEFAKFVTNFWPDFFAKTLVWLFIISFSVTIFNMMPLPVFDGDRVVKEILDWIFGEKYGRKKKKRKERFYYKHDDDHYCKLTELRVENVEYVKIHLKGKSKELDEKVADIFLSEENYKLVDRIGDGFNDSVYIDLPEDTKIKEKTMFEVSYEYLADEKQKYKKPILNIIRIVSLAVIAANFIFSFIFFGFNLFWL